MFGQMFFTSLMIFPFVYIVGYYFERFIICRDLGRIGNTIKHILFFIGVIFHELSHRLMQILVGVPAHNMKIKYRDDYSSRASPHGSVKLKQPYQMTFLQGFLGSFAPVLFGAWVIFFLVKVAFSPIFDPLLRIIAGICIISIFFTLSPSRGDLSFLRFTFQNDPRHSWYQIFLFALSTTAVWIWVGIFNILFPFEFCYYFLIIAAYVIFKYSFILLRVIVNKIQFRNGIPRSAAAYRRLARKHYKTKKRDGRYS